MGGRLRMSERERQRIGPLRLVVRGELTLAAAAVQMGISYRQALRVILLPRASYANLVVLLPWVIEVNCPS